MSEAKQQRKFWNRLKRNKGALFGIVIITLSVILAIVGYWVSPDGSPYANRMTVEIGGLKPGSEIQFLKIPFQKNYEPVSFFHRTFYGKPDQYQFVPIKSYQVIGDSVSVQVYIDEETSVESRFASAAVAGKAIEKRRFWLGTDKYGRDILSRLIIGVRVSLSVGLITVIISLSIGVLLGALAGYYGGRTDALITWFINVIWSIPTLLLVFAITFLLGKGFWQVFVAIGLTMWVNVARIVRGQIIGVRELEYVEAGRALGYTSLRILFRHILPNIMGPVLVVAASNFASAIVIEAGLSFLGIGVQPPQPSWGLMIKENYNFIITHNPMLALAPGFAIMLLVLAFNLLGNGVRDALATRE
jgi:ABC-type dipeptide/oligopeptide/nickel transport system permease subunit